MDILMHNIYEYAKDNKGEGILAKIYELRNKENTLKIIGEVFPGSSNIFGDINSSILMPSEDIIETLPKGSKVVNINIKNTTKKLFTTYPLLSVVNSLDDAFKEPYSKISDLYKPQFGDYIPRERILEIWYEEIAKSDIERTKTEEENKDKDDAELRDLVHNKYINQYKGVCKKQVWALSSLRKIIAQSSNIEKSAANSTGLIMINHSIRNLSLQLIA